MVWKWKAILFEVQYEEGPLIRIKKPKMVTKKYYILTRIVIRVPTSALLKQGLVPLYNNKLEYMQQKHAFLPLLCGNVIEKKILKLEMGLQLDIVF